MTDLHGITITPGILPAQLRDSLAETVNNIGAKLIDSVRIDTTHFVCTEPRGQAWEKAVELNVPVVVPDWIKGCEREGRIVGVRGYYLDADPKLRQIGPSVHQPRGSVSSVPARDSPRIETTPPTPERSSPSRDQEDDTGPEPPTPPTKTSVELPPQEEQYPASSTTVNEKSSEASSDEESEDTEKEPEDSEKAGWAEERPESKAGSSTKAPTTPGDDSQFSEVEL